MQTSVSTPSARTSPSKSRLRRWLRARAGRAGFVGLILLLIGLAWFNEHRTMRWHEAVNPLYWLRRHRGEDLYHPHEGMLLHGNRDYPEIALTFDDGPHIESRAQILDTLRQENARATFFDVGRRMTENPQLVRRALAEGHEIANHSYHHYRLDGLSPQGRHREINDTDITFTRITGQHLRFLRPPGMRYNAETLTAAKELGYVVVGYTTASRDFDPQESPEFIANRTLRRTENGSILLLHDYAPTAAALPQIIRRLKERGYRFVTLSEMIAHLPKRYRRSAESQMESDNYGVRPTNPAESGTLPEKSSVTANGGS